MATLEKLLNDKLNQLMDQEYQLWVKGDYIAQQKILFEEWDLLPEPKGTWNESYSIVTAFIDNFLKLGEFDQAKKWSEVLFNCHPDRKDNGERELYAGMVAYELGDFEKARDYFDIVQKESGGRLWKRENVMKYFKFYKEKK